MKRCIILTNLLQYGISPNLQRIHSLQLVTVAVFRSRASVQVVPLPYPLQMGILPLAYPLRVPLTLKAWEGLSVRARGSY